MQSKGKLLTHFSLAGQNHTSNKRLGPNRTVSLPLWLLTVMEHWLLFAWISDMSHPLKAAVLSGRIRWRLPIGGDGSLALCQLCFNCTFPSLKGRSSYKQTAWLTRRCVARPCPLPSPISPSPSPLTIPSKLIEVGSIALHSGDGINSKLISQMDALPKK